jgi:hypothetical protein
MNAKRFLYWVTIGALATLGMAVWMTGPAYGQCCGWRWNSYYETTYGRCGCETCQPTYFVPRLRPCETYTACGYRCYCSNKPRCDESAPEICQTTWPYSPCVAPYLQTGGFERLGEVPNDMIVSPNVLVPR